MGSERLALCLDDATDSDIRAHRHRQRCGCRGSRRATVRPCRRKLAGASRVLRSSISVYSAKFARGGRCGIHRAWEIVHVTPRPVFVFSCQPADDDATVYSRMFGACIGIPEDPATGAASGPLGAYLLQHNAVSVDNASRLVNLQGVRMGRPGRIYISLSSRAGVLEEVRVGGEAVVVGEGTILD